MSKDNLSWKQGHFFTRNICLSPTTRVPKHPIQTNTVLKPSQTPKTLLVGKLATLLGWASFQVRICQCADLDHDFLWRFFEISYPPSQMPTNTCRWSFGALAQKSSKYFVWCRRNLTPRTHILLGEVFLSCGGKKGSNPKIYTDMIHTQIWMHVPLQ